MQDFTDYQCVFVPRRFGSYYSLFRLHAINNVIDIGMEFYKQPPFNRTVPFMIYTYETWQDYYKNRSMMNTDYTVVCVMYLMAFRFLPAVNRNKLFLALSSQLFILFQLLFTDRFGLSFLLDE